MSIDYRVLEGKLKEMYPEIQKQGVDLAVCFDDRKDAWIVELSKGGKGLRTHLERKDAEACLDGVECVYLGVQIGQFVKEFET